MSQPAHDPAQCFCGSVLTCSCPCGKCRKSRERAWKLERRQKLLERLEKAGIDMADLADLLWMHVEPTVEARIERMAHDCLRRLLRGVTLVSTVKGTSADWAKDDK